MSQNAWLTYAREMAQLICQEKGQVTINDVREICPPPDGADPRIMGAVFPRSLFHKIGYMASERAHGRPIGIFALNMKVAP